MSSKAIGRVIFQKYALAKPSIGYYFSWVINNKN